MMVANCTSTSHFHFTLKRRAKYIYMYNDECIIEGNPSIDFLCIFYNWHKNTVLVKPPTRIVSVDIYFGYPIPFIYQRVLVFISAKIKVGKWNRVLVHNWFYALQLNASLYSNIQSLPPSFFSLSPSLSLSTFMWSSNDMHVPYFFLLCLHNWWVELWITNKACAFKFKTRKFRKQSMNFQCYKLDSISTFLWNIICMHPLIREFLIVCLQRLKIIVWVLNENFTLGKG